METSRSHGVLFSSGGVGRGGEMSGGVLMVNAKSQRGWRVVSE